MMQAPPPTVKRCLGCGHTAHLPAVCGAPTFFTHTCTCPKVYDPRHDVTPDFDERKAFREHDEGWYPNDRD